MRKLFIVLPLVLAMSACSSFRGSSVTETKTFSNEVDYPKWYTEAPKKDSGALYSVASEFSGDFQFSVDKAMLSAKIEFEQMVKELPFTTRKIVNHQINIMR